MTEIDRGRLSDVLRAEEERFVATHRRSGELFEEAKASLLAGVPMPWMTEWAGPYPVFAASAEGAHFTDVDGNEYVDLCLGDTGAMTGHAPPATVAAIAEQAARGITLMLPTEDSAWVAGELSRRFGLPYWQFALTATDANRFTIRLARAITGRQKILVYNWCYHGTVDETFAIRSTAPPCRGPTTSALRSIPRHDGCGRVERRRRAGGGSGERRDRMCAGRAGDDEHRHRAPRARLPRALRALTREHDTLLMIDETHTICAGPGGYTAANHLDPDFLTIGKPLGAGVPAAAYGMSAEVADRVLEHNDCSRSPMSAASAARSRATPSRSRRCGPRSRTSSPRTPSSA